MNWSHLIAYFFGGAFAANSVPHYVAGVMGRPFQSPFASPPGKGLSSSRINIIWALINLIAAYFLVVRVGHFDLHVATDVVPFDLGAILLSLQLSHAFGRLYGGNKPSRL